MVFHVTNYMRETNVWMIRKMRWMLWGFVGFVPIYRNVYWDYLGRRVVLKDWIYGYSEDEKKQQAIDKRANWGYKPRYEPIYDFSLKRRKYATQTLEEKVDDTPRLRCVHGRDAQEGLMESKEVETLVSISREHNRLAGAFDYKYPQTFYSLYPEIDQETYVTVGNSDKRRVHDN